MAQLAKTKNQGFDREHCFDTPAVTAQVERLHQYLNQQAMVANLHGQLWYLWADAQWGGTLIDSVLRQRLLQRLMPQQETDGGVKLGRLGPFTQMVHANPMATEADPYATALFYLALRQQPAPAAQ